MLSLQYRGDSFLFCPGSGFAGKHLFAEKVREFPNFEWFNDDFVRFQRDSGHGDLDIFGKMYRIEQRSQPADG
jgi:translation elongation factor EF-1alpha